MTYKAFIWTIRLIALFSLAGVGFVVFYFSPYKIQDHGQVDIAKVVIFNVALFLFLASFFSMIFFRLRKRGEEKKRSRSLCVPLGISLRQGIFLALGTMALVVLQGFRVLTWWDGLLAFGAIMIVELYFLTK